MRSDIVKQVEPTEFPKHQVRWENIFRQVHEASSKTECAGARIYVVA
jgi:hypothetical protein